MTRRLLCVLVVGLLGFSPPVGRAEPARPSQPKAALATALTAAEQRYGPSDPKLLPMLATLAQQRFEDADIAAATALRRRALKIAIANDGSLSAPAAEAMAALAHLYIELRRYLDAEPLAIAAQNVLSARLGGSAVAMAPVLADRARIALAHGDTVNARDWAQQAVAIDEKTRGAPQSNRLRVEGAVLVAERRFSDGERVLSRALALDRAGGDGIAVARSLAQLGKAYMRQQRFAAALPLIEEATAIDQDRLGPTHPLIAEDLHDLGSIYLATSRPADAAIVFRAAKRLLERGCGRGTRTLAYVELALAHAEHVLGHKDKSQSLFDAARHILDAAQDEERDRERRA